MTTYVEDVSGSDVAAFVGRSGDATYATTVGALMASTAREAAKSYTRGVGFETDGQTPESLRHVILLRAVRMAMNYSQLVSESRDSVTLLYGSAGQGWTLTETQALDGFRRRAA